MSAEVRGGFYENWPRNFWKWLKRVQKLNAKEGAAFTAWHVTMGCYLKCSACSAEIWVSGPLGERYFAGPYVQQNVMATHLLAHGIETRRPSEAQND